MFTGIIEETGKLKSRTKGHDSSVITITCQKVLEDSKIGDSIAVNGVCLTVTQMGNDYFTADVMNETMSRSCLGDLKPGDPVNLERAMQMNGRFGGHIVSGHIDGTGTITEITKDDNAYWYTVQIKPELLKYIVEKGSITINGISLTVAGVDKDSFCVSVIPHTRKETNLFALGVGSVVNLECDLIGKYVEQILLLKTEESPASTITEEFLRNFGF